MAIQLGDYGLGVKRHAYPQNAEMNVTPFVDVILVLLIIFMVAAPLATVDVPLDLPSLTAAPNPMPTEPIYISVQRDGAVYIQNNRADLNALAGLLLANTHGNRETRIFVRGDEHVEYGRLMAVMNVLQAQGYSKVGLIAAQGDN